MIRNLFKNLFGKIFECLNTENLIKSRLKIVNNHLIIKGLSETEFKINLSGQTIYIFGAGKAVFGLCKGFLSIIDYSYLENKPYSIHSGLLIVPTGSNCSFSLLQKYNIDIYFGAKNNLPDEDSVNASEELINRINTLIKPSTQKCLVIFFISGGGSALLSLPNSNITLKEKCEIIKQLANSGCTINELNCVRKSLSQIKGGLLALNVLENKSNIKMINLIVSDVISDSLDVIASGPTVITTSNLDSRLIMKKYGVSEKYLKKLYLRQIQLQSESIEEIKSRLMNILIMNNRYVIKHAEEYLLSLGYNVIKLYDIDGEARKVAKEWANILNQEKQSKVCLLGGGETTVNLSKIHGIGGRCQEFALQFALSSLENNNIGLMACATDGQDGPTDVGCVIYCSGDLKNNIDEAKNYLERNDSFNFWNNYAPECLIRTAPSGSNVSDIYCAIKL